MKTNNLYLITISAIMIVIPFSGISQIIMPTSGTTNVSLCSGTFYDSGGSSDLYYGSESGTLTVCPSTPGRYIQVDFSAFETGDNADYLFIYDGNSTNAKLIAGFSGTTIPTSVRATTSNPGGCLTFKFISLYGYYAGWTATFSCQTTGGTMPVYDNRDCYKSTLICSNATFAGNSSGPHIDDLSPAWIPCASTGERQSSWYYFRMATGGLLGLTINPSPSVDYDFAIWGPYGGLDCPANTQQTPVRCSYSSQGGDTGLNNTAGDVSEDATGDKWVSSLPVSAGQVYVLNINNFSQDNTPFNLIWNLQNGATFNCSPLPVGLSDFTGKSIQRNNILSWNTFFEENNDYFEIEKSEDGNYFSSIGRTEGAGNSTLLHNYQMIDYNVKNSQGFYYRLKQVDINGTVAYSNVIYLKNEEGIDIVNIFPNPPTDVLNVTISSQNETDIYIEVISASGNQILKDIKSLNKGRNQISLDVHHLATGIYHIRVVTLSGLHHVEKEFVK